jgi:hypothetical protein
MARAQQKNEIFPSLREGILRNMKILPVADITVKDDLGRGMIQGQEH